MLTPDGDDTKSRASPAAELGTAPETESLIQSSHESAALHSEIPAEKVEDVEVQQTEIENWKQESDSRLQGDSVGNNDSRESMQIMLESEAINDDSPIEKSDDTSGASQTRTDNVEQAAEDSATSKDLPYSTRGRSTDRDFSSGEEKFSAVDTLEEMSRVKESPPVAMGVSFLEALSEEERRTRTRFVPEVEGMHILRKHEIKDDLSLARSLVSSSGITSLKKSKGKNHDAMDVDDEDGTSPSEDGSTDAVRPGTKLLELPTRDLIVPSNAFVAPSVSSGDDEGQTTSIAALKTENGVKSPLLVEAITAFNPPRPPESIGAKKKHRMLRWERRPEDVEVDLNNYRKTVQRTRQELQKAEAEYNRLETIDAHLRWNFLINLNLMNEEYTRLSEEISSVQQECVKAADLLTSRTRSRGAGKGSYVMRDVLSVLKAKGAENAVAMDTDCYPVVENPLACAGIGGLAPSIFDDWNRHSTIMPRELASAWIVPGDKVATPYGEGVVVEVFSPYIIPEQSTTDEDEEHPNGGNNVNTSIRPDENRRKFVKSTEKEKTKEGYLCQYLSPRVSVKLSFGVGYFGINVIKPLDNPCLFSDTKLLKRWNGMMETALLVGSTIDLEGMNFKETRREPDHLEGEGACTRLEKGGTGGKADAQSGTEIVKNEQGDEELSMPFGANMLPTATGRGNLLHSISITEIEKAMETALYHGRGVLGVVSFACHGR